MTTCQHCHHEYTYDAQRGINVDFVVRVIEGPGSINESRRLDDGFVFSELARSDGIFSLIVQDRNIDRHKLTFEGLFSVCPKCSTKSGAPVLQVSRVTWPLFDVNAKQELANETLRSFDDHRNQQ